MLNSSNEKKICQLRICAYFKSPTKMVPPLMVIYTYILIIIFFDIASYLFSFPIAWLNILWYKTSYMPYFTLLLIFSTINASVFILWNRKVDTPRLNLRNNKNIHCTARIGKKVSYLFFFFNQLNKYIKAGLFMKYILQMRSLTFDTG